MIDVEVARMLEPAPETVHSCHVALGGFLGHSGHITRLVGLLDCLPELRPDGEGKLGGNFSRDFSRLKISLGFGKRVVFHSFRHTFRTVLESSDLRERHIDAVMGHEGGSRSEGKTYAKRVLVSKLRDVVETFESPLLLDFLPRPDHEYVMPTKKRRLVQRR